MRVDTFADNRGWYSGRVGFVPNDRNDGKVLRKDIARWETLDGGSNRSYTPECKGS